VVVVGPCLVVVEAVVEAVVGTATARARQKKDDKDVIIMVKQCKRFVLGDAKITEFLECMLWYFQSFLAYRCCVENVLEGACTIIIWRCHADALSKIIAPNQNPPKNPEAGSVIINSTSTEYDHDHHHYNNYST